MNVMCCTTIRRCGLLAACLAVGLLHGCANRPSTAPADAASTQAASTEPRLDESGSGGSANAEQAAMQALERLGLVVYFDFDTAEIRAEQRDLISAHARFLGDFPERRVRLEGHADERGTREYNIGLGERRAQAVRRALLLQGALDGQLSTVSYGEERPATAGSEEAAWAKNRRVELRYLP